MHPLALIPELELLLLIPYPVWEELVLRIAGPGAHASEFLVEAAANGDLRFAKYLVAHSAKVNTSIRDRSTPLSAAAIEDRTDIASYLNCAGTGVNH